jgi:hypothetical protein
VRGVKEPKSLHPNVGFGCEKLEFYPIAPNWKAVKTIFFGALAFWPICNNVYEGQLFVDLVP